jgi:glutaryl-CoA dehydrogenase
MYKPLLRTVAKQSSFATRPVASRNYAAHATPQPFNWEDPLNAQSLLTEDEIAISETAEAYCQERMLPRVLRESQDSIAVCFLTGPPRGLPRRVL